MTDVYKFSLESDLPFKRYRVTNREIDIQLDKPVSKLSI